MPTFVSRHSWFWLWGLPVMSIVVLLLGSQGTRAVVDAIVVSPLGMAENLPTVFLAIGVYYAWRTARLPQGRALRGWMLLFALALIFFAGEDQNWFQYWLGAEVPDYFIEHNKEQEINLHNMNSWFNQKPRLMVEIWALVGCFLVPMGIWTWPQRATARFVPAMLWPDRRIVPIAVIAIATGLLGRVWKHISRLVMDPPTAAELQLLATQEYSIMDETFPGLRFSEMQELLFAYLMMLFAVLLYQRLKANSVPLAPPSGQ